MTWVQFFGGSQFRFSKFDKSSLFNDKNNDDNNDNNNGDGNDGENDEANNLLLLGLLTLAK